MLTALLGRLKVVTDQTTPAHALGDILNIARRYRLSACEAAYLELAMRSGLPLATLDAEFAKVVGSYVEPDPKPSSKIRETPIAMGMFSG